MSSTPDISVVVPVYKEEGNIRPFLDRLRPVLEKIGSWEVLFCLDPSPDRSEEVIRAEAAKDPRIGLLVFSRRFGQPAAIIAGILECSGETCIAIDIDLQDPPELIPVMYAKLREGYEVVNARRTTRKGETLGKKLVSHFGYWLINKISDIEIPRNTGDFRIMTRRVIEELRKLPESQGFLRGLVGLVGFRQAFIDYEREVRFSGTGNYNRYLGSIKIGLNGVFGFSSYPLSLMMWIGLAIALLSVLGIPVIFLTKYLGYDYPVGIPTIIVLVLFMGGVQLAAVGVVGEYIGRIFDEVRRRPRYIIDRAVNIVPHEDHDGRLDEARRPVGTIRGHSRELTR